MLKMSDAWSTDELSAKAHGGTELMKRWLWNALEPEVRESVHLITTRVREIDPDRPNVLWVHDLVGDPECEHLRDAEARKRFAKIVFVSRWQFDQFRLAYGITYDESEIIPNAIEPFTEPWSQDTETIRLIYHTTPHRGLEILVPVVEYLTSRDGLNLHLDVFSSFRAYGWPERDKQYADLFERIRENPNMTYHGFKTNDVIREALLNTDIFAYPCIWQETSCIALMEALSAGCHCIVPDFSALVETGTPFATFYRWSENPNRHAANVAEIIRRGCRLVRLPEHDQRRRQQRDTVNAIFDRASRLKRWQHLFAEVTRGTSITVGG